MGMPKVIRNFLNGSVYGITLIIPGVSATIFAIILKFYDELIYVINHFRENSRKNAAYLLTFLFGVAAGAVFFSSVISFLLENYALPTMLFFIGLLIGIVPLVFSNAAGTTAGKANGDAKGSALRIAPRELALAVFSMAALYALSRLVSESAVDPADAVSSMNAALVFYIFLAGIINGATLVIPGLSGALILLIMGLYPLVIHSISSIGALLGDLGNFLLFRDICAVLLPFGIGGFIGCLFMAKIMEKLMRNSRKAVYAVILGLLLGSIITLLKSPLLYQSGTSIIFFIVGAIMFFFGTAAAYFLGKKGETGVIQGE